MTDNNDNGKHWEAVKRLFGEAVSLPESDREAFLQQACGDDSVLLAEVRALLDAGGEDDSLLRDAVQASAAELVAVTQEHHIGQRIGNYKLVRILGSGGMGNVYLAERADEQFDHRVAVKVLQTGQSDPHFVQRFRSERQLLARLNHPNIARLLDGGESDAGTPYLVMEYVEGLPVDTYCDARRLDVAQRLALFKKLCGAIDYAHRNLVVHRDIKPSNILITNDGEPKLLDFGVAKMIDAAGPGGNLATVEAKRMLTPEYASPEQVRGEPVSISTDIYSLGVLLYRLLCGRAPYEVRDDFPSDLARAIVEDEPSKPSAALVTRPDTAGDTDNISARRHSTTARLRASLQGDLDNIALMALRKEPEHRYESARAFHDDIDNFLAHRPVVARPAGIVYRGAKFIRRHRVALAATVAVVAVLLASAVQIVDQRNRAEVAAVQSEEVTNFLARLFASASPAVNSGDIVTATDLLAQGVTNIDELGDQPVVQSRLLHIMGNSYAWLGYNEKGLELMRRALAIRREHLSGDRQAIAQNINDIADNERILSNYQEAERMFTKALDIYRELYGEEHIAVANVHGRLGDTYRSQVRLDKARASLELALSIMDRLGLHDDSVAVDLRGNLALVLDETGHTNHAIELQSETVAASRRVDGDRHPNTIVRITNLGLMQHKVGDYENALVNSNEAFAYAENEWASHLSILAWITYNRANVLRKLGRLDEAEDLHRQAVEHQSKHSGEESPRHLNTLNRLGAHYLEVARFESAIETLDRVVQTADRVGANPGRYAGRSLAMLAEAHNALGQHDRAEAYARQAIAQTDAIGRLSTLAAMRQLAVSLSGQEQYVEASTIFEEVIAERAATSGDVVSMLPHLLAASRHYRAAGATGKAVSHARRAFDIAADIRPVDAWPAAEARGEYGLALRATGDESSAAPIISAARSRLAEVFGENDPRVQALAP